MTPHRVCCWHCGAPGTLDRHQCLRAVVDWVRQLGDDYQYDPEVIDRLDALQARGPRYDRRTLPREAPQGLHANRESREAGRSQGEG